jgi:hypothetical protein
MRYGFPDAEVLYYLIVLSTYHFSCLPESNPGKAIPFLSIYRQICGEIETCLNGRTRSAGVPPVALIWLFFSS